MYAAAWRPTRASTRAIRVWRSEAMLAPIPGDSRVVGRRPRPGNLGVARHNGCRLAGRKHHETSGRKPPTPNPTPVHANARSSSTAAARPRLTESPDGLLDPCGWARAPSRRQSGMLGHRTGSSSSSSTLLTHQIERINTWHRFERAAARQTVLWRFRSRCSDPACCDATSASRRSAGPYWLFWTRTLQPVTPTRTAGEFIAPSRERRPHVADVAWPTATRGRRSQCVGPPERLPTSAASRTSPTRHRVHASAASAATTGRR